MIFRHFADERIGDHSYLIASPTSRDAAIVNPNFAAIDTYRETLDAFGLRLVCTLRTDRDARCDTAARRLENLFGAARVAPAHAAGQDEASIVATPGRVVSVGEIEVRVIAAPPGYSSDVAYQAAPYTFAGTSVLVDRMDGLRQPDGEPEAVSHDPRSAAAGGAADACCRQLEKHRASASDIRIEQAILLDLRTSLDESRFSPREARVVEAYIRAMEERGFEPPSAAEIAELFPGIDRSAVHLLVHNIRWKQIDLGRLPLLLAGQTSKWLRGLQTRPDFTSHEREFLQAYFRLLEEQKRPPSGPEIAETLGEGRSVQWVRKRAHTIRRKQREFEMPELILARKGAPGAPRLRLRGSRSYSADPGLHQHA